MDKDFIWTDDVDCAITVCDKEGKVLFQNKVSTDCFSETARRWWARALCPATPTTHVA